MLSIIILIFIITDQRFFCGTHCLSLSVTLCPALPTVETENWKEREKKETEKNVAAS